MRSEIQILNEMGIISATTCRCYFTIPTTYQFALQCARVISASGEHVYSDSPPTQLPDSWPFTGRMVFPGLKCVFKVVSECEHV